jgi:hypothetical protein
MAFTENTQDPDDERLDPLCSQLGELLGSDPGHDKIATAGLGESFDIWLLLPQQIDRPRPVMPHEPSGFRHFQIYIDGRPAAHTVVRPTHEKIELRETIVSTVAGAIDQAIEQIDKYDKENSSVRFLFNPSCYVYAFWLSEPDIVYVIAAPTPPPELSWEEQLRPTALLSTTEFLGRLKRLYEATGPER